MRDSPDELSSRRPAAKNKAATQRRRQIRLQRPRSKYFATHLFARRKEYASSFSRRLSHFQRLNFSSHASRITHHASIRFPAPKHVHKCPVVRLPWGWDRKDDLGKNSVKRAGQ